MYNNRKRCNLSLMSDEEIIRIMDSVSNDDESEDNNSVNEDILESDCSDYAPESELKIADADLSQIENYLDHLNNTSAIDLLSSTLNFSVSETNEEQKSPPAEPSCSGTDSLKKKSSAPKRKKRARSPLPILEENAAIIAPNCGGFYGTIKECTAQSPEFKNITWKKKSLELHQNEIIFYGERKLPQTFNEFNTPYKCFMYFWTEEMLNDIVTQTILYAHQQDIICNFSFTCNDLKKYIAILLYMSVYRYPNVESYWSKHALECIRSTMPSKRFYEIRKYLHFNDSANMKKKDEKHYDQLYKIRPVLNKLNERFDSVPKTQRLCVDEQMCSTKMKTSLRQYMPNKPHKYGIKLFVLCDTYGFSYQFEVYRGAGDNDVADDAPDLGATGNVVVRLTQSVPILKNHIIYFDNFYTSLPLLVYLRSRGIYALGTIRSNRLPNSKLSKDSDLKNKERGYSEEFVGNAFGVELSSVLWKDTKCVRLVFTYVGIKPFQSSFSNTQSLKATRFDRKQKKYIEINCPNIVKEYNYHMGGVDLMDGLLGRYHIRMKTKKWTLRLFYHMLDMSLVNAYILYNRIHNIDPTFKYSLKLPEFRVEVADVLCKFENELYQNRVGRPKSSSLSPKSVTVNRRTYAPAADIRYDGVAHVPDCLDRSGKKICKMAGCKSETQMFCTKCKLNLCLSSSKKCFQFYHIKP